MIIAAQRGKGRANLERALAGRLPFRTSGALRGGPSVSFQTGILPAGDADQYVTDLRAGAGYVVWSYATPIAWVRADGSVHVVAHHFSATTSRHQSLVRAHLKETAA